MIHEIKVSVDEVIEYNATHEDKVKIIHDILFSQMTDNEFKVFMVNLFNNLKETELEFDNRYGRFISNMRYSLLSYFYKA